TGLMDNSIIVFTADHGENLGEHHYITHGHPYERALHVPLMFHFPDERGAGVRVSSLVEVHDILPTIMEMLDMPVPDGLDGISFKNILDSPEDAGPEHGRPFVLSCGGLNDEEKRTYSLFDGNYRSIKDIRWSEHTLLYDILNDPLETTDISAELPDIVQQHHSIIDLLTRHAGPVVEPVYDPETYEMLKSLGYI
ncbi:MAG TPA: hypothetical protein ENN67_08255, partial [Firmicutes bacterium]|nr:hypothetical protein [Bacillota bacterium]